MRKSLLYIVLLLTLVGACTPEDQLDNLWIGPTCHDGIRNQDEEDIDCGGRRCSACEVFIPVLSPCTNDLKDNTLTIDDRKIAVKSSDRQCDDDGTYTIGILIDGQDSFTVTFADKPVKSDTYSITTDVFNVGMGQAAVHYDEYGYDYPFNNYGSDIYVSVAKDKTISVEFCSVTLSSQDYWGYERYHRIVSGRISGCPE